MTSLVIQSRKDPKRFTSGAKKADIAPELTKVAPAKSLPQVTQIYVKPAPDRPSVEKAKADIGSTVLSRFSNRRGAAYAGDVYQTITSKEAAKVAPAAATEAKVDNAPTVGAAVRDSAKVDAAVEGVVGNIRQAAETVGARLGIDAPKGDAVVADIAKNVDAAMADALAQASTPPPGVILPPTEKPGWFGLSWGEWGAILAVVAILLNGGGKAAK